MSSATSVVDAAAPGPERGFQERGTVRSFLPQNRNRNQSRGYAAAARGPTASHRRTERSYYSWYTGAPPRS